MYYGKEHVASDKTTTWMDYDFLNVITFTYNNCCVKTFLISNAADKTKTNLSSGKPKTKLLKLVVSNLSALESSFFFGAKQSTNLNDVLISDD